MYASALVWGPSGGWKQAETTTDGADIVFYFGLRRNLAGTSAIKELRSLYPSARLVGCSTGGHVLGEDVVDDEVAALAMKFERTPIKLAHIKVDDHGDSHACGAALGAQIADPDLSAAFVLSDGLRVNGAQLVAGLVDAVGASVRIAGGLAGDGADFSETLVGLDDDLCSGQVVAIGFYGPAIQVRTGSAGGWDVFGPRRRVTQASGNVLLTLDGEPALDLYERYLGSEAPALPGSGLLFPLKIFDPENPEHDIVRTLLAIDRDARSMTFAGDIPQGWTAQLMRGSHHNLVNGAADAGAQARAKAPLAAQAALLVSCIGRRLLMGQRTGDEIEAAASYLGEETPRAGFYSYGELAPHARTDRCELHNQTMTVTTFAEAS